MKKVYIAPEIEMTAFEVEDIITVSGEAAVREASITMTDTQTYAKSGVIDFSF